MAMVLARVLLVISLVFVSLPVWIVLEGTLPSTTLETTKSSNISSIITLTEDGGCSFLHPAEDHSIVTVNPITAQVGNEEEKSSTPSQDHEQVNFISTMANMFEKWHAAGPFRLNSSEMLTALQRKEIKLANVPYQTYM